VIDAHVHLDFFDDPEAVVARARAAGVTDFVVPGVSPSQWAAAARFAHHGVGLHPEFLGDVDVQLAAFAAAEDAAFVGECGLDRRIEDRVSLEEQRRALRPQLARAKERDLPVVLHCVHRHGALLELLREHGPLRGMLHGFTGPAELVREYVELGLHLGVGAAVMRPHAKKARDAVVHIPPERLLLETDAPDQPPPGEPTNEPAFLPRIAGAVAVLRGEDPETLGARAAGATRALFGLT